MSRVVRGFIDNQETNFLALQLDQINPETKEAALEKLCKWYRTGYKLRQPHSFRQRFTALLHHPSAKVVRWTLNAIAIAGSRSENLLPTLEAIERYSGDDDVLGAGVAALIALTNPPSVLEELAKINVPLQGAPLLAAAQQSDAFMNELTKNRVKPDNASASELRFATILVGLNKAPPNLFEPRHDNETIVGVLNHHDDKLVAQYSIWAITENPALSIKHLKIPWQTRLVNRRTFEAGYTNWLHPIPPSPRSIWTI